MSYTITQIEDAIVDKLKASSALSAICKSIASYHAEIDDIVSIASQLTIQLPAVYVLYAGSTFTESANRSYDDEMTFTVVIVAKDLRGDQKLKASIYQILEEVKTILIDNNLDLDIEPIHPVRVEATIITKLFSIYSFDIKTSHSL